MVLKKILMRIYHGFAITMIVNLAVHLLVANLLGSAVTPGFAARFSSDGAATLAQLMLVAVIGVAFSLGAMIFEIERWSFLKQGIVHFLATAAVWMPIAWICWAPYSGRGVLFTIMGWTLTYIVNWLVQYSLWKRDVRRLNLQINACRAREEEHEGN